MTRSEAILAVRFNSICESNGIRYYAYGLEYIHEPDKKHRESIILHDLNTSSITHAEYRQVSVVDWKAPDWLVESQLKKLQEQQLNKIR